MSFSNCWTSVKVHSLASIKPHGGFVGLRNDFDTVWALLKKHGDLRLKTEKKKTNFVAKASTMTPRTRNEPERAIVFLRGLRGHGKLKEAAACFECCWKCYYNCHSKRIGMYCRALDRWASTMLTATSSRMEVPRSNLQNHSYQRRLGH
jgi:hypothetical protein